MLILCCDIGGPLYDKENDVLVGIVSWGYGCADDFFPGVYSRVADQVSIIMEDLYQYKFHRVPSLIKYSYIHHL